MKEIIHSFIYFTFSDNNIMAKYYENEYLDDDFLIPVTDCKASLCLKSDGQIIVTGKMPQKIENAIFRIVGNSNGWPFGEEKEDIFRINIDHETQLEYDDTHCF
jgi:hypothetical protein